MFTGTILFVSIALATTISRAFASSAAADQAVVDAIGAALQADAAQAVRTLRAVPQREFAGADREFRVCMLQRFGGERGAIDASSPAEPFALRTLEAFRAYWRHALLDPEHRDDAEAALLIQVRGLLGRNDAADLDALEPVLIDRLAQSGYHALLGRTLPLREFMLWRRQETRAVRVVLPEGAHTTKVAFLDDFASLGWADYATCHRRGAGGWATDKALYAVVPRYASLDGEEFRVTFLGHETQHFADYARFPALAPWELEYRAKLVELAQAKTTVERVLRKFTEDQGDDPASPHAYANRRVLTAVRQRLALAPDESLAIVPVRRLHAAAAAELRADTERRTLAH